MDAPIQVKFLTKSKPNDEFRAWHGRFPGGIPLRGSCHFSFDRDERNYDWLVVYDDLPSVSGERFTLWEEALACPRAQTLLITTEPSTIKIYGKVFLRQFGHVLTSQEPWIVRHPGAIFSQTGLIWFYGGCGPKGSYDYISAHSPLDKSCDISTVCSSKQQKHTLHNARFEFTQKLKAVLPSLDIFGHGVRFIDDKADALDTYRYHVAIENHVCPHHWTEKLSDAFLGSCLPFYHGCPNAADYFPEESFIPINIHDFGESAERICKAIRDREYEKRLPAILESRRLVLDTYSLFPLLSRLIAERHPALPPAADPPGQTILSRHALRRRHPGSAVSLGLEKLRVQFKRLWTS
jgi:hypothetical protein